ncbi:MAG: hypothetical protein P8P74_11660 [Crocinitomicaceae bacterium]|nr:hypothetical protein [Crocinitomicaceae bacterium]
MRPLIIFLFLLILFGCKKNETPTLQDKLNNGVSVGELLHDHPVEAFIGKNGEGGIIFYLDTVNCVGLSALAFDMPGTYEWGCTGLFISPGSWVSVYGLGAVNTAGIVDTCQTFGTAAEICYNLDVEGFDDWYLPGADEALEMNRQIGFGASEHGLTGANQNIGNFNGSHYWTSTQVSDISAKAIEMDEYPTANYMYKVSMFRVRPIRIFSF